MTNIQEQFENIWKLYSIGKEFKEEDKPKYYQIFLDGYSCALLDVDSKKQKPKEEGE